jgi:hypothetical protein
LPTKREVPATDRVPPSAVFPVRVDAPVTANVPPTVPFFGLDMPQCPYL